MQKQNKTHMKQTDNNLLDWGLVGRNEMHCEKYEWILWGVLWQKYSTWGKTILGSGIYINLNL